MKLGEEKLEFIEDELNSGIKSNSAREKHEALERIKEVIIEEK